MASQWKAFKILAENLVFKEAPKLLRELPNPERVIQQGLDPSSSGKATRRRSPSPAVDR